MTSDWKEKACQVIAENYYMTIATCSLAATPWVSPVFFAYDTSFNLYWVSSKDTRHSKLIRENQQVAIVIFNSQATGDNVDAVYCEANAFELSDSSEIENARHVLNARITDEKFFIHSESAVTGAATWRIYKAAPKRFCKLVDGEIVDGQYIDKHIDVQLP
jgi:nitroimidazol reductase NimA-like FMN-containing flavoprotein (pyridoxamine 5'-phosphate oxidase superfamily)